MAYGLLHGRTNGADWLIERKKLSYGWQDSLRSIREQLTVALKELPDVPEITDLLKGQCKGRSEGGHRQAGT